MLSFGCRAVYWRPPTDLLAGEPRMTRTLSIGAVLVTTFIVAGGTWCERMMAQSQRRGAAPAMHADPLWPRPLPNHWILGSITGVAVDARDHIWVVHRGMTPDSMPSTEAGLASNPVGAEICCQPAPQVLEFDAAGALVSNWGGPGANYEWPVSPGGVAIDDAGNVWITAAGVPEAPVNGVGATGARAGGGRAAAPGAGGAAGAGGAVGAARGAAGAAGTGGAAGAAAGGGGAGRPAGGGGGGRAATPPRPTDAHVLEFSATGQFILQIGKAGETAKDNPAN